MSKKPRNPPPLVRVEWMDAEAQNDWVYEDDIEKEVVGKPCVTVGFLVRKPTKNFPMYMIASTMAEDEAAGKRLHNAVMKIPKVWVTKVEELDAGPNTKPEES